jgi:hypothetical protein
MCLQRAPEKYIAGAALDKAGLDCRANSRTFAQGIPQHLQTPEVHYRARKSPPLSSLSWGIWVQTPFDIKSSQVQSILVSGTLFGPATTFPSFLQLLLDSYLINVVGHLLWR